MTGSSLRSAGGFAIGVWIRATAIGALAFGAIEVSAQHLYATALVLAGAAVIAGLELAAHANATDRLLAQFVSDLAVEGSDRLATPPGLRRLGDAVNRAFDRLSRDGVQRQARVEFAEALADSVLAALLVVDETGSVVRANRAAHRLLGEVAGPLDQLQALGPDGARRLRVLGPGGREIVRLADDRSVLAAVNLFRTPGAPPLRLIALQSLSSDLDPVVLKSWRDLVRVLAHEMMNSLTPICSLSDSVAARLRQTAGAGAMAGDDMTEIAEAVEVIARRGEGLMNFVDRYRKLAETPAANRTPTPMRPFVEALDRLMTPLMREAGVDYASAVEPSDLVVEADRDLLEQATINLLKNALDAVSGRPGAMIRLACLLGDAQVVIAIEDNGPGLAIETAETAFVPFFTTKAGGSGIGLTLSRQIALAHDGRLEYAPRHPTGAVFRLVLPYGTGGRTAASPPAA